jgi:hypothetical protein
MARIGIKNALPRPRWRRCGASPADRSPWVPVGFAKAISSPP